MSGAGSRTGTALLAGAVAGALVGGLAALAVVGLGRRDAPTTDDRLVAALAEIDSLREQLRAAEARLAAVEARPDPAAALEGLAADVLRLRNDARAELELVDGSLLVLSQRIDRLLESGQVIAGASVAALERELTEEERERWAELTRDPDYGQRVSALVALGRHRSDRGVQAAIERLEDEDEVAVVLWQAMRNLARFEERSAAVAVARLLDHQEAVVRAAAFRALTSMGAPDPGFDPVARPEERSVPMAQLRDWAEQND